MARQRIGDFSSRGATTPQSVGFRLVTRPFAAEPWPGRWSGAAKRQAPEPDPALQPRALNALGQWIEKAGGVVVTAEQERSDVPSATESEARSRGSEEAAPRLRCAPAESVTGLPDDLKDGIERLSGLSMEAVKVHYDSPRPFLLDALAYTQGTEIHLRPGEAKHVAHEAWHVVQQLQGRVRPTRPAQDGVAVNDDAGLEREADVMGERASRLGSIRHIAGASSARATAQAESTAHDATSIDPAMHASRPAAITGWLGGRAGRPASGRLWSLPEVVQRLQAPPNPPKTEWNKAHKAQAKGNVATDSWLSYSGAPPQPPAGYKPVTDPPGYRYIRLCGLTQQWIRFHLVNELAGGPGTDDNLVPTSQKTNTHPDWKKIETKEKNAWNAGATYHFAVHVDYHAKNNAPALPGEHWQEYFPSKIEAALSTIKGGAWHTDVMNPIHTALPPLNPAQIDYDLTTVTGHTLNKLLDTKKLGPFMAANSNLVTVGMTANDYIEDLHDAIGDVEGKPLRTKLFNEFDRVDNLLHDFITGQGTVKLNLK